MICALEGIAYWIIDRAYRILRPIFHCLLAIAYWSRGQKVPRVRDPILKISATELAKQIREGKWYNIEDKVYANNPETIAELKTAGHSGGHLKHRCLDIDVLQNFTLRLRHIIAIDGQHIEHLTSECVVRSFIDRILEVEPLINAIVDRRFGDALKEAEEVDAFIASRTVSTEQLERDKPLLGVPFTVKVLLIVKGLRCTAASYLFEDLRAQEDAESVTRMKNAGAIVLATTNAPEMGMNFETNNHLHGATCNPYDTSKTSGGSSGGESAILSAAGSVIGLGNDLAGSVRVPSMFCGIFGHKPTRGIVSAHGCFPTPGIKISRLLSTGPMCRYATDLVTMMKILALPEESKTMFGRQIGFEGVKVYYMCSFGKDLHLVEEVDPEIKHAVKKAASYFETKHGATVKEINLTLFRMSNRIFVHNLMSSSPNFADVLTAGKVKVDPILELVKVVFRQSQFMTGAVLAMNAANVPFLYREDMVDYYKKQEHQLDKELSNLLDERSILIVPTMPFAAPYHNEILLLAASTCYTSIFNALGLPVTQCPLGLNKQGLPIGVQIVGLRGNDHLTIACAIELEKAFGGWIPPR